MYLSTRDPQKNTISFSKAMLQGLAPDGGLYLPQQIKQLSLPELRKLSTLSYPELVFNLLEPYINDIPNQILKTSIQKAYQSFDNIDVTPTIRLGKSDNYLLELWHGPTAAFKDIALQLMGHLFSYCLQTEKNKEATLLTATSGDTGSAALAAFTNRENCRIIVLFPQDGVSPIQKQQMTTLGIAHNALVIAIKGDFDAAQTIVKQLQLDKDIAQKLSLSSANSINIARLLPQITYYFKSYFQVKSPKQIEEPVDFVIPSANMGDALAGYLAKMMGLPIGKLIISTNVNDSLARFFQTGLFQPSPKLIQTDTCSMDILYPNNLERLLHLYLDTPKTIELMNEYQKTGSYSIDPATLGQMQNHIWAAKATMSQAHQAILDVYNRYQIIIDPHSAVGWHVGQQYQQAFTPENSCIYLCTAHPAKFPESIQKSLSQKPPPLPSLDNLENKPQQYQKLPADFNLVKENILKHLQTN